MRPTLTDDNPDNGRWAATAFFALAAVNPQTCLIGSGLAVGVEVVLEAGSSVFQASPQHLRDGSKEPLFFFPRKGVGQPFRMDARFKQRFVGVDVAHPGDETLVQQERLDPKVSTLETFQELWERVAPVKRLQPKLPELTRLMEGLISV